MTSGAPVAVQPLPRGGLGRVVGRRLTNWAPAVVVLVGTLAIWQEAIDLFHVKKFLLPQPWTIATTFWDERHELLSAGWLTFQEAFGGFAIGCGLGILLAALADGKGQCRVAVADEVLERLGRGPLLALEEQGERGRERGQRRGHAQAAGRGERGEPLAAGPVADLIVVLRCDHEAPVPRGVDDRHLPATPDWTAARASAWRRDRRATRSPRLRGRDSASLSESTDPSGDVVRPLPP